MVLKLGGGNGGRLVQLDGYSNRWLRLKGLTPPQKKKRGPRVCIDKAAW